jgi:hypothetical protein
MTDPPITPGKAGDALLLDALGPLKGWWECRYAKLKAERREALAESDDYSAACATGGMLELLELQSHLIARGGSNEE